MINILDNKNKSFTLIELLVVIAIIGLLSSVVLVSMNGVREKAQIAKGLDFSNSVQNALGIDAVGVWNFETLETGNIVLDSSGYGNNGTVYGGAVPVAGMEQLGNALQFDGVNDYVDCGNSASLDITGDITVELWATGVYGGGGRTLISKGNILFGNDPGYAFQYASVPAKLYLVMGNGTSNLQKNMSLDSFGWTHLAFTRNSSGVVNTYKNGAFYSVNTLTGDIDNTYSLLIGESGNASAPNWNGLVDGVRIYSTVLTSAQVQSQYYAGLDKLLARGLITEREYLRRFVIE
jgi:prepilin-type N-terminal cleavage/methylation domain-containing protein